MNTDEIVQALTHLVRLLSASEASIYAHRTPSELITLIAENLESVKRLGHLSHPEQIEELFLPTASLQEIAMDNGWADEYLALAERFDTMHP